MADSILRLKVESQEYDSKLKRATEGLQHYQEQCRKIGGTLSVVEDETLAFVKALGDMPTVAKSGTQQLKEMSRSVTDLTMQYRALSEEEKQSPFGQAMSASIQTLIQRTADARDAVGDVTAAIKNAASDTRVFDQIAGAAGLTTSAFQTLQGASKLLGVDIGDNVEVLAKLQAAMAVTNGLTQIQTALQKESAVMQGVAAVQARALAAAQALNAESTAAATVAQKAFNAVAKANPYVLLGTAILTAAGALAAFSRATKDAEESEENLIKRIDDANKKAQEQATAFVNASANMMLTADRISKLQAAYVSANTEIEKTSILKDAQTEFHKLGLECKKLSDAQNILINKGNDVIEMIRTQGTIAALTAIRVDEYKKSFSMLLSNGYDVKTASILAGYNQNVQDLDEQIIKGQQHIADIQSGLPMTTGGGRPTNPKEPTYPSGSIADLTQQLHDLKAAQSLVTNNDDWEKYQQKIKNVETQINSIKGIYENIERTSGKSITTSSGLADFINNLKKEIQDADFGSDIYNNLTAKLADATMLQNLVKESLSIGLGTALFDIADETGQDFWDRILSPEGVENADWQAIADVINKKRKELGLDAIVLDFNTGNISSKAQNSSTNTEMLDTGKKLVSGLSQVSSGLNNMGIKLSDEANQFLSTAQGVISVIEGLKTVAEVITGSTSTALVSTGVSLVQALLTNTLALSANTTATAAAAASNSGEVFMDALKIAAVAAMANGGLVPHAAKGYAVPGRHYSGDVTPIMANAGELVLNRAQQGNLASQLQESDHQSSAPARPYVTGQEIYLGLNNYLTGSGQGEIITSKNIKSYIN